MAAAKTGRGVDHDKISDVSITNEPQLKKGNGALGVSRGVRRCPAPIPVAPEGDRRQPTKHVREGGGGGGRREGPHRQLSPPLPSLQKR